MARLPTRNGKINMNILDRVHGPKPYHTASGEATFTPPARFTPPAKMLASAAPVEWTVETAFEQIRQCRFMCPAGPLESGGATTMGSGENDPDA